MPAMPYAEKVLLKDNYGIALCRAKDKDGRQFFHYVMAEPKEIERLYRDYEVGATLDFSSYGTILCSGWAENPSDEDKAFIEEVASGNY